MRNAPMADLKMPEINIIHIAGNLTRDPVFRRTTNGTPVINFCIASNHRYRDINNRWQEDVCYIGIVAWNRLAENCAQRLKKGSAVLVCGELQSHTYKADDGLTRHVVEIKAQRIQFLNRAVSLGEGASQDASSNLNEEESSIIEDDGFDKFLTSEESQLLKEQQTVATQG
jgi:single-strand DNA-binding protein